MWIIKINADFIILITWLMLKLLFKSKDMLFQVSSDLGEKKSFYSSFSDAGQKSPLPFKSSKNLPGTRLEEKTNTWSALVLPTKAPMAVPNEAIDCYLLLTKPIKSYQKIQMQHYIHKLFYSLFLFHKLQQ